jgi:Na+-driven multidrug efflux pump
LLNGVLLAHGGSLGLAALMIVGSIQGLAFLPILGYCQGQQPLIGFNYGAKAFLRVRKISKYALMVTFGFGILAMLICQFAAEPIVLLFTKDSELIKIASTGVRIAMTMAIVVGVQIFMSVYFQYIGKAKYATILTLLRQVVVLIPLVFILPKFFGLNGIWAAWPVSDVIVTIITAVVFIRAYRKLPKVDDVRLNKKSTEKLFEKVESEQILAEESAISETTAI